MPALPRQRLQRRSCGDAVACGCCCPCVRSTSHSAHRYSSGPNTQKSPLLANTDSDCAVIHRAVTRRARHGVRCGAPRSGLVRHRRLHCIQGRVLVVRETPARQRHGSGLLGLQADSASHLDPESPARASPDTRLRRDDCSCEALAKHRAYLAHGCERRRLFGRLAATRLPYAWVRLSALGTIEPVLVVRRERQQRFHGRFDALEQQGRVGRTTTPSWVLDKGADWHAAKDEHRPLTQSPNEPEWRSAWHRRETLLDRRTYLAESSKNQLRQGVER